MKAAKVATVTGRAKIQEFLIKARVTDSGQRIGYVGPVRLKVVLMNTFDSDTFAATLKKTLPNARISVTHHSAEEIEAGLAALHALNSCWNHNAQLGSGVLYNQKPEGK